MQETTLTRVQAGSYTAMQGRVTVAKRGRQWHVQRADGAPLSPNHDARVESFDTLDDAREYVQVLAGLHRTRVDMAAAVAERVAQHRRVASRNHRAVGDAQQSMRARRVARAGRDLAEGLAEVWERYGREVFGVEAYDDASDEARQVAAVRQQHERELEAAARREAVAA